MNYIIQLYTLMDQLWNAVEEYYILPISETSPDESNEVMVSDAYSRAAEKANADIQTEQIALDQAHISIQEQKAVIQDALRRAKRAAASHSDDPNEVRNIFASVFRTFAPSCARLFNACLQRKRLSRISITISLGPNATN
jgi:hypothetical protein